MSTERTTGVEPVLGSAYQPEPLGSVSVVERDYGTYDIRVNRPFTVPALSHEEARKWLRVRAKGLRGMVREVMMDFLTREWRFMAGWHVGTRRDGKYYACLRVGAVDASGCFKPKGSFFRSAIFSASHRSRVIDLVAQRIREATAMQS